MVEERIDPTLRQLMLAHPLLFREEAPTVASHVPAGWYGLLDRLCCDIEAELGREGCVLFEVSQIKEKFGTLRFYYRFADDVAMRGDVMSPGAGAKLLGRRATKTSGFHDAQADQRLQALVDAAGEASASVCVRCGASGTLHNINGWWATLCETDSAAFSERRKPT